MGGSGEVRAKQAIVQEGADGGDGEHRGEDRDLPGEQAKLRKADVLDDELEPDGGGEGAGGKGLGTDGSGTDENDRRTAPASGS